MAAVTVHVGQAALDAVVVETELFMIEAEQVEHCRESRASSPGFPRHDSQSHLAP